MSFPAGLTMVSVHCRFDLPPGGGSSGQILFISTGPLLGAVDNSIVPPFEIPGTLDGTGQCTVSLPATNDPDWTPVNWWYQVQITIGNGVNWIAGTLQLDYHNTAVELARLLQPNGTAAPGVSYIPLSLLGQPNGPAQLDGSGNLTVPTLNATTAVAATVSASVVNATTAAIGVLAVAGIDFRIASAPPNPVDQGLAGWTFDPALAAQAASILPTAGLAQVVRFRAMTTSITAINFFVTVGGTLTAGQCKAALFNDAGALLGGGAVTGSLDGTGAGGWGDAGYKTCPLTVAQGVTQYAWYRIMFWANGGVLPTFARASNLGAALTNAHMTAPTLRFSTADAGLTTTAPANIGAQTASAPAWWVGATP